ncbi:MAG: amidohydrolase [Planctomycetes bacterium]|nr:amidohydrolase [Planctomycetota bacterium]
MSLRHALACTLAFCAHAFAAAQVQEPRTACDVLLRARRVHGVAGDEGGAFVAWSAGKILAAGPSAGARAFEAARTIELDRAMVTPGLVDAHGHLLGLGDLLEEVNLVGTTSYAEVIERVVARARTAPAGTWVVGRGWDQNDWTTKAFPEHGELSRATPDHPVWLVRVDGHAALANARAMALASIPERSEDPPGGRVLRDAAGRPTGVFVDRAMRQVGVKVSESARPLAERLLAAQERLLAVGLTGMHDAGIEPETVAALEALIAEKRWKIRIYGMWGGRPRRESPSAHPSGLLDLRAVKLYADGALGSRGAALLADYSDEPGVRGLETMTEDELFAVYLECLQKGFQACTHAIGDRGNRNALQAFDRACRQLELDPENARARRFRMEHAQVVAAEDFARFAANGWIASMQPTHCTSDMDWAVERLGAERAQGAYAWRAMLTRGVPLAFGSDFPVEDCDPRLGIFAALTRTHADGTPRGGWFPEQRLEEAEALSAFTAGAARAAFAEERRGKVAIGFDADLSVFDPDPALAEELGAGWLSTRARMTIVAGQVVYERSSNGQR